MVNPNIHNLQQRSSMISTESFIAVNSDPNIDVSIKLFLILNHMIGTLLQNNTMPV